MTASYARAGTLSTTMEARGFGASTARSHARTSTLGWPGALMLAVAVAIPVLALGGAVAAGTFRWLGI